MHILQDAVDPTNLNFKVVKQIKTVHSFLSERDGLAVLSDMKLVIATKAITQTTEKGVFKSRDELESESIEKSLAMTELCTAYTTDKLPQQDLRLALESLADANAYLVNNRDPVNRMLYYLETIFPYHEPNDEKFSLEITCGQNGSHLSHSHSQQFTFVRQSLTLWREIQHQMFKLWILADEDFLSPGGYRLCNTGQGLQRVQPAPNISRVREGFFCYSNPSQAMSNILGIVQCCNIGGWVGLSVVHLGDRDVPNALVFIGIKALYSIFTNYRQVHPSSSNSWPNCEDNRTNCSSRQQPTHKRAY